MTFSSAGRTERVRSCRPESQTASNKSSEGVHHQPCPRPRVRPPPSQATPPAIPGALLPTPAQATPPAIPGAVMLATRASHTAPIPRRPRFPRASPAPLVIPPIHHVVMPRAVIPVVGFPESEGVHHQPCPRPRVRPPPSQATPPAIPGALLPAPAQATPPAIPGAVMPATRASHTAPIPRRPRFPRASPAPLVIPPIHHVVMPRAVIPVVGFPEVSTPVPPPAGYPAHTKPRPCARPRRHSRRPIPYLAATACHPAPSPGSP
eukprot:XP_023156961.1 vegetative cell wall protein gp1-like [Zea mays]